jgi:hypothetical protein
MSHDLRDHVRFLQAIRLLCFLSKILGWTLLGGLVLGCLASVGFGVYVQRTYSAAEASHFYALAWVCAFLGLAGYVASHPPSWPVRKG